MDDFEVLVYGCLDWYRDEGPDDFDPSFLQSLQKNIEHDKEPTETQISEVEKIIKIYNIDDSYFE